MNKLSQKDVDVIVEDGEDLFCGIEDFLEARGYEHDRAVEVADAAQEKLRSAMDVEEGSRFYKH